MDEDTEEPPASEWDAVSYLVENRALPVPTVDAAVATPVEMLAPAMRPLAIALAPTEAIVDCGGDGRCCPNSIAFSLKCLGRFEQGGGDALRAMVVAHAAALAADDAWLARSLGGGRESGLHAREYFRVSMQSWPAEARQGRSSSWEAWLDLMAMASTWGDEAFLAAAADCFLAEIEFRGVNADGEIVRSGVIEPGPNRTAECRIVLALWVQQHYAAIVKIANPTHQDESQELRAGRATPELASPASAADAFLRGMEPSPRPSDTDLTLARRISIREESALEASSAILAPTGASIPPLTTREQVQALLHAERPPTVLVAMEFSGSLRAALESRGVIAISADLRPCEREGLHFQGDVREIIDLTQWRAVYFFPNCFQQLRADTECLPSKIIDGRAFWGCAMVLWCMCCPFADLVVVEQPDTIAHDFGVPDGVHLYEFRTSALGDPSDKFVRLAIRGVSALPPLPGVHGGLFQRRKRLRPEANRSHAQFADPEARDRARSTWASHPNTCLALAQLLDLPTHPRQAPDYHTEIHRFALAWRAAGHPVPKDFDAPQGAPPSREEREYQLARGHGAARGETSAHMACDELRAGRQSTIVSQRPQENPEAGTAAANTRIDDPHSELLSEASDARLVDIRQMTEMVSLLLFICIVGQPLVYAHLNGFTILGVADAVRNSRPACMAAVQRLVSAVMTMTCYAFMVGEYRRGARLFAAPVENAPAPTAIIRTPSDRRRALAAGGTFAWCTLLALSGTPMEDAAARAILAARAFTGSTDRLADFKSQSSPADFSFGARTAVYLTAADSLAGTLPSTTTAAVLEDLLGDDEKLAAALDAHRKDPLLAGWRDIIKPMDVTEVPSGLLSALPSFGRELLDTVPLTTVPEPIPTSWMPLPPRQAPVPGYCPRHVSDLMLPETKARVQGWLLHNLKDLVNVRDALADGQEPSTIQRDRPRPMAVGQSELHEQARGRVWDCRLSTKAAGGGCCQVADFHAPFSTHLNLTFLREQLTNYPDQTLVANLLEGVRLDADVELQAVLIPHLASLPLGFASVEKELRRLHEKGWYDFFSDFPFWPMYVNGQGATARKLEPDRFRRTTEGGGPRHPTFDQSGLKAWSINEASHTRHLPRHLLEDDRPEMEAWKRARDLTDEVRAAGPQPKRSKWPKERKPQLAELMRDMAVLRRAAHLLSEPIYIFGDDAKDYFNQLAMANSELHKLGIVFLERKEDELTASSHAPEYEGTRLVFVSEKRLGFGTHGASNIAQRFSNALLDLFRDRMDEAEAQEQKRYQSPALKAWLQARESVQRNTGEACHQTRRYARSAAATTRVCPQQRLYTTYMFTDDPIWVVVGVERTLRALREWRQLTDSVGLIMAIPEKRSLGAWSKWLGILIIPALGLVVVPRDKILRAVLSINEVLGSGAPFHVYRSLCGLLEHFRAVIQQGRNVMHGLYAPHGEDGASKYGPSGTVVCDDLMRKQLQRWVTLLSNSCGASVTAALDRRELRLQPTTYFHLCSDAMYEPNRAAMGGFCHGLYWSFEAPTEAIPALSIPILEFLGVVFNIIVFGPIMRKLLEGNPRVILVLRTDALTAALTLPAESQRSPLLIAAFQWLREQREYIDIAAYCLIAHLFGDANPYSDCISRGKWEEFRARCKQIGVKPIETHLPFAAYQFFDKIATLARTKAAHDAERDRSLAASMEIFRAGSFLHRRFSQAQAQTAGSTSSPTTSQTTPGDALPDTPANFHMRRFGAPKRPRLCSPVEASSYREPIDRQATPRLIRGLPFPSAFPARTEPSALTRAGQHYARSRLLAVAHGGDQQMQLRADLADLVNMSDIIQESVDYGTNANTAQKDDRAWLFWEKVCDAQGTTPLRSAQDVREYPERQAHLLAVLLLYAFSVCVPTDRSRQFIKPKSALAYPLAIIRVFSRWGIIMPGYKSLIAAMNGLMRLYIEYHGPHSLAPRRAEPMKFIMMRAIYNIPQCSKVGRWQWTDADHNVFIFRRLNVFLMHTAFRLGEIVAHRSGEIMFITRACVVWSIGGVLSTDPTPAQLHALRPGLDYALVAPPRSKPDQWGEIHCPFPVTLTFDTEVPNAAACLRDIELRNPCSGALRHSAPLFADQTGAPYSHGFLGGLLSAALTFLYGAAAASLYTFHSYRSGLATALHAAGVSDDLIQLICRWMCPESLHVYRRIGTREHEGSIRKAATMDVDVIQSVNVPKVTADAGFGELIAQLQGARGALAQKEFESVRKQILPSARTPTPAVHGGPLAPQPTDLAANPEPPSPGPPRKPTNTPFDHPPAAGTAAFIARECWPDAPCQEHGGAGWTVEIRSATKHTAVIAFLCALTPSGVPYAPIRVQLSALCKLE